MKSKGILSLVGCLLTVCLSSAQPADDIGFNPKKNLERISSAYLAPENMLFFRMRQPNGVTREFERDYSRPGVLRSVRQWSGRMKGDKIVIKTGPGTKGGPAEFVFKKGRLVGFKGPEAETNIAYEVVRPSLPEHESPLLASGAEPERPTNVAATSKKAAKAKWARSGRLQFPFGNPNRNAALYGELALFLLGCALAARSSRFRFPLLALSVLAGGGLVLSGSRGAMLGTAVGLATLLLVRVDIVCCLLKSRWVRIALIAIVALFAAWLCFEKTHFLTRGFRGGSSWSNQLRTEIWANAPKMMVDAPGGWGSAGDIQIGRAYLDWYQPLHVVALTGSLISDHLTRLAGYGWFGRWLYLFGWFALFLAAIALAKRKREPLPLGLVLMFGITAWFNPIFSEKTLWIVPVLALVGFVREWPLRKLGVYGICAVVAAVLAGGTLYGLWAYGSAANRDTVRVTYDDGAVKVKSSNPSVWTVDDGGPALGGLLSSKDIRLYYQFNPHADGIGYVRDVSYLPKHGVKKLVLGGKAGDVWLRHITSDEEARRVLPEEVVFISPPFPFAAIPSPLFQMAKVRYLVGEFCTWYQPKEYAASPVGVEIVPGCEMYIPGWLDYVL